MTVEVLRGAVEHHVGAQAQGLLVDGAGEGAVDEEEGANSVRQPGALRYIDELHCRVRRALDVHYFGVLLQVPVHLSGVRRLDHRGLNSEPRQELMDQSVAFAVEILDRQEVRPLAHEREDGRRDRCHPRGEEGGVFRPLEFSQLPLQPTNSRVVPPGIDE